MPVELPELAVPFEFPLLFPEPVLPVVPVEVPDPLVPLFVPFVELPDPVAGVVLCPRFILSRLLVPFLFQSFLCFVSFFIFPFLSRVVSDWFRFVESCMVVVPLRVVRSGVVVLCWAFELFVTNIKHAAAITLKINFFIKLDLK